MSPETATPSVVDDEKGHGHAEEVEKAFDNDISNIVYDLAELEPEVHLRTYLAVASMIVINFVQVLALQGPPTVVRSITCWMRAIYD